MKRLYYILYITFLILSIVFGIGFMIFVLRILVLESDYKNIHFNDNSNDGINMIKCLVFTILGIILTHIFFTNYKNETFKRK